MFLQLQLEKEKQNYDFENVQSQLDKALGQATRLQKEREAVQLDVDRLRDKYEKAQVGKRHTHSIIMIENIVCIYNQIILVI